MAYCPHCGADASGSAYCPNCGARLDSEPADAGRSTNPFEAGSQASGYSTIVADDGLVIPTFIEAVKRCLLKTFNWRGRASRAEFWFFAVFLILAYAVVTYVEGIYFFKKGLGGELLLELTALTFYLLSLTASIRRLHDGGWRGWHCCFILFALLTWKLGLRLDSGLYLTATLGFVLGGLFAGYAFILLVWKPAYGPNRYGPEPYPRV